MVKRLHLPASGKLTQADIILVVECSLPELCHVAPAKPSHLFAGVELEHGGCWSVQAIDTQPDFQLGCMWNDPRNKSTFDILTVIVTEGLLQRAIAEWNFKLARIDPHLGIPRCVACRGSQRERIVEPDIVNGLAEAASAADW